MAARRFPRGGVAAPHYLASTAGLVTLARGGNAIDAAISANLALGVVAPYLCGYGGDVFAVVWDGQLHGYLGSGRSPAAVTIDTVRDQAGFETMPVLGPHAVTVPGGVAGWFDLLERWGTRSFGELAEPALAYARDGFELTPMGAMYLGGSLAMYEGSAALRSTYEGVEAGDVLRQPGLARPHLDAIDPDDAARALVLWVNSPSNPTGALDDLAAASEWGRTHGVPVFSDECYCEFTWDAPPRTILEHGLDGVVAVHSLSKRSNLAGLRVGFYAGDAELVTYLQEVRKHVGLLVPGPAQAAGVVALDDDEHVRVQRDRYRSRLVLMADALGRWSRSTVPLPAGGFYLWFEVDDGWAFAERLAREGGALVSPGEFYGARGANYVRVAVVQPLDRLNLVVERLGVS